MCKRFWQNLLLLLTTLLLIVIGGEMAVRLFTDLSVPMLIHDEVLGMTFRANTTREIIGPESGHKVSIRINSEGFRTPPRPETKPPGTIRIALVGDSQVAAINTRTEDTMALQLEKKLNLLLPGTKWEVFNFGVSGANTAQELNLYRKLIRKYDMDVVVCAYYNGNDFSDNSRRLTRIPRISMDFRENSDELITLYPAPTRNRLSNWLNEHSRLYVWQKHVIGDALNNFRAMGGAGKNRKFRNEFLIYVHDRDDEVLAYSWRINEMIIKEFNKEVMADGAHFVFLSIPHGIEIADEQWQELQRMAAETRFESKIDRDFPERKLRSLLEASNIDYLLLRNTFTNHLQNTSVDAPDHYLSYRNGLGHLNETGNLLMTDTLIEHLRRNGTFNRFVDQPRD